MHSRIDKCMQIFQSCLQQNSQFYIKFFATTKIFQIKNKVTQKKPQCRDEIQ